MRHLVIAILLVVLPKLPVARGQESAPVTIDTSPTAAQLMEQAAAAAAADPIESARLVQESVDRFTGKLVPWPPEPDRFRTVEAAAESFLRDHPEVLRRWRVVEEPVARRRLEEGEAMSVATLRPLTQAGLAASLRLAQAAADAGRPAEAWEWLELASRHPGLAAEDRARVQAVRSAVAARLMRSEAALPEAVAGESRVIWQPLWSQPLDSAWMVRRAEPLEPGVLQELRARAALDGAALLASPTFDGASLLVADGSELSVRDRFGGGTLWSSACGRQDDRVEGPKGDVASAVPGGKLIYALPGHAIGEQRTGPPAVLAFEAATGRRRWELRLDQLPLDALEELFPHGRPLPHGDLLVVQCRKSNSRLETAAWLLGVDREEGRLRWATSLGAAGGTRVASMRPLASPKALGADVVAATSLGVVARIDPGRGHVRWLRRWPSPAREPRDAIRPWQLASPVADASLVAWISPDGASIVGLDPSDGRTLWTRPAGPGSGLGTVRTLLMDAERLYAIGDDVVAMPRSDPQTVAWKLSAVLGQEPAIQGETAMGELADGAMALAVPTRDAVRILAPSSGAVIGEFPCAGGGNVALDRGQLAVATADRLTVAMPGEAGERLLRERLGERPSDPRRGLALLELGRAWGRGTLIEDGARAAALAATDVPDTDPVRQEVIDRLVEAALLRSLEPGRSEGLLTVAMELSRTPRQRASVMLRQAARLADQGQGAKASRMLLQIWKDPGLSGTLLPADANRQVAAGVEALELMVSLDETSRLEAMKATLEAATDSDRGLRLRRSRQALLLGRSMHRMSEAPEPPVADPGSIEGAAMAALPTPVPMSPMARCGPPQREAFSIPGALVEQSAAAASERPSDVVLLREDLDVVCRGGEDLEPRWRTAIAEPSAVVLSWTPALCLWSRATPGDGVITCLDPLTGAVRFRIDGLPERLGPSKPGRTGDSSKALTDASAEEALECRRAGPMLLVVRGDGRVAAMPVAGKGDVAWVDGGGDSSMECWDASPWGLATVETRGEMQIRRILVRDVRNPAVRLEGPWPSSLEEPQWVRLLPEGLLVCGRGGMAMLELDQDMPIRWLQRDRSLQGTEWVGRTRSHALVRDRGGVRVQGVEIESGRAGGAIMDPPSREPIDPVAGIFRLPEGWLVHRFDRLSLHDDAGRTLGVDAVATVRRYDRVQPVQGQVVVVDQGERISGVSPSRRPSLLLRTLEPAAGLRLASDPVTVEVEGERLESIDAVDGWILLGFPTRTVAVRAREAR